MSRLQEDHQMRTGVVAMIVDLVYCVDIEGINGWTLFLNWARQNTLIYIQH
jgi:hypothetical protein